MLCTIQDEFSNPRHSFLLVYPCSCVYMLWIVFTTCTIVNPQLHLISSIIGFFHVSLINCEITFWILNFPVCFTALINLFYLNGDYTRAMSRRTHFSSFVFFFWSVRISDRVRRRLTARRSTAADRCIRTIRKFFDGRSFVITSIWSGKVFIDFVEVSTETFPCAMLSYGDVDLLFSISSIDDRKYTIENK